ncbi:hypothetical protein [Nonomuraea sp. NPDC052265]|uniref:hypothetical protein n=1 Tax=Nonomuraea sp. NPDC052265 TaxID=3364374 RepID=UPI0037CA4108
MRPELPAETFRVFPNAMNHRNVYDDVASVRRAVAYRKSNPWEVMPIRVYRAVTVWEDVTHEYVKAANG